METSNLTAKTFRDTFTLIETRSCFRDPAICTETPIAHFRLDRDSQKWSLFSIDRNDVWHLYDLIEPSNDFDDMLKALDTDKTGTFRG